MADDATMTLSAVILPTEIAHTLGSLTMAYAPADANDKWFYSLVNVTASSGDLIAGNFLCDSAGVAVGSSNPAIREASDLVKFLFIKNTGTTDGSSSTSRSVYVCFDGGTAAYNTGDVLEIGAGESWYGKPTNALVGNIHAVTGNRYGASAGSGNIQCIVAAVIDDS